MSSYWWQPFTDEVFAWWLTAVALGWIVFPLVHRVFVFLPDRGLGATKFAGMILFAFLSAWTAYLAPFDRLTDGAAIAWLPAPFGATFGIAFCIILVVSFSTAIRTRKAITEFLRSRWKLALAYEVGFLGCFLLYLWFRSYVPDVTFDVMHYGAEKWPNLAILTTLWRSGEIPCQDPWLAGFPLNYYYFGHWLWMNMTRLAGTTPEIGFNLGLATQFALLISLCFSAGWALTEKKVAGWWAVFLIALAGPLSAWRQWDGLVATLQRGEFLQAIRGFNFWTPSEALPYTRNEFPAFNWLLGDLHAHATGLLTLLLGVLALIQLQRAREMEGARWRELLGRQLPAWFFLVILMSAMWMTNSWDLLVFAGLGALWLFADSLKDLPFGGLRTVCSQVVQGWLIWLLFGLLAIWILANFYTRYTYFPLGLRREEWADLPGPLGLLGSLGTVGPTYQSTIFQWFAFWGMFAAGSLIVLLTRARMRDRLHLDSPWVALSACGVLVAILVSHYLAGISLVGAVLIVPAVGFIWLALVSAKTTHTQMQWISMLIAIALACQIFPEFFFVDDPIGEPYERYNTVFKLYYPAWALWGLALAALFSALPEWTLRRREASIVGELDSELQASEKSETAAEQDPSFSNDAFAERASPPAPHLKRRQIILALFFAVILIIGGFYPILGVSSRVFSGLDRLSGWRDKGLSSEALRECCRTLDGLAFMRLPNPDYAPTDLELGLWMRNHLKKADRIAEAPTNSYSMGARFATISGIPCFLGWLGHEAQWRGMGYDKRVYPVRFQALQGLYSTVDADRALEICRKHNLRYVAVGTIERQKYLDDGLAKFGKIGRIVAQFGNSVLYEMPIGKSDQNRKNSRNAAPEPSSK